MSIDVDVVIVGAGPAGVSAALWCQRLNLDYLMFEGRRHIGGQLHEIRNRIVDYPGVVTNNGQELAALFEQHLETVQARYQTAAEVTAVSLTSRVLALASGEHCTFRRLVLATGARPRRLGIQGEDTLYAHGRVPSTSRDAERFKGQPVVVVGGGDRAFEGAINIANFGASVTLIHRTKQFRARSDYQQAVLCHPRIRVLADTTVTSIQGDGAMEGVQTVNADGTVSWVPATALFIRIGVVANSELISSQVDTSDDGFVIVNSNQSTGQWGIYAIGDVCTPPHYSSVSTAAGQAVVAAKHMALTGHLTSQ